MQTSNVLFGPKDFYIKVQFINLTVLNLPQAALSFKSVLSQPSSTIE